MSTLRHLAARPTSAGAAQRWPLALTLAGLVMAGAFAGMVALHHLRRQTVAFLGLYALAYVAFGVAICRVLRRSRQHEGSADSRALALVLALAVLFRVILLFTSPPTLSDDVYRYIWDGRLMNAGINPYAFAVNSPQLDALASPLRHLVNHNWMATPYLPAAQALFAVVYRIAPESALGFQVTAVLCDLLTGVLLIDLLRHLRRPVLWATLYLWNPLVIVEFAHGAHVDAWMILALVTAVWALLVAGEHSRWLSVVALSVATLVKPVPALLLPLFARRWGWRRSGLYVLLCLLLLWPFAQGAGWGLSGALDGTGVFGATRIYAAQWNYNSSVFHWTEAALASIRGTSLPGPEASSWPARMARVLVAAALAAVELGVWRRASSALDDRFWLRWTIIPLGAYILLTTTVHPWYIAVVLPLLPFVLSGSEGERISTRLVWPWLYLAGAVALSYMTYRDPANLRDYAWVRVIEYVPFYLLLGWATWPAIAGAQRAAAPKC